ncbi:helix-turn-helix domain-containing protein [Sinorhizobium meliloti]|uniref:helix-turn-helix domain-containing protein n=1 Tax=Rhizobium meliloti TaxID=382 RepID=UPI00398C88ED
MPSNVHKNDKLAYSIREVSEVAGLSPATIHKLCNEGHLVRRKVGKRTFILAQDLENFFLSRPREKYRGSAIFGDKEGR